MTSRRKTTTPWYYDWLDNSKIPFQRASAGAVNSHLSRGDGKGLGKLRLEAKYNVKEGKPNRFIIGYHVKFTEWQMKLLWRGILLVPRGEVPPPPIRNLGNWDGQDRWEDDLENGAFDTLVSDLQAETLPSGKDYQRLEALMAVAGDNGGLAIDIVRFVLLKEATASKENVALVVFCGAEGDGMSSQNGGGSGPPNG